MAAQAEGILLRIKVALGTSINWEVALPLIDEWAMTQFNLFKTYCDALELFHERVCRGEWPQKDGCPKCFGIACCACDFTGTRSGYEAIQRMEQEGNEAWDIMAKEHAEYVARGICSRCGACSPEQAATLCKPTSDESGEHWCPAEDLWEQQRENT